MTFYPLNNFYLIIFALKLLIEPFNLSSLSMKIVIFAVLIDYEKFEKGAMSKEIAESIN